MVRLLASNVENHGSDPLSGQTKDNKLAPSAKHLGVRITNVCELK
jgi:hypothetical protein